MTCDAPACHPPLHPTCPPISLCLRLELALPLPGLFAALPLWALAPSGVSGWTRGPLLGEAFLAPSPSPSQAPHIPSGLDLLCSFVCLVVSQLSPPLFKVRDCFWLGPPLCPPRKNNTVLDMAVFQFPSQWCQGQSWEDSGKLRMNEGIKPRDSFLVLLGGWAHFADKKYSGQETLSASWTLRLSSKDHALHFVHAVPFAWVCCSPLSPPHLIHEDLSPPLPCLAK